MKKRLLGLLMILTSAFIIILGTKAVYAKEEKGTLEYDVEYEGRIYEGVVDDVVIKDISGDTNIQYILLILFC